MHWRRTGNTIEVLAPAKLNLFLEVLAKRADGFHEIETLIWPIRLHDTVLFERVANETISIEIVSAVAASESSVSVPTDEQNLAARAALRLREAAGVRKGARMRLIKRIPTEAGLGGGSSDAAAALVAANEAWGLNWPLERLAPIAAEVGSDVPFFLQGAPAVCRGRGEQVQPIAGNGLLSFVVVRPPEGLSTAGVYQRCRPAAQPSDVRPLIGALTAGDLCCAGKLMHNQLQPAAEQLSPWIARLRTIFEGLDVAGHLMSGSGSSYFALCRHDRQARAIAARLRGEGLDAVFVA